MCTYYNLCIANTYCKIKSQHKVSSRNLRSKHWDQLYLIIVSLQNVLHTRFYHSADCDTDHTLVYCKIKVQPKRIYRIDVTTK